MASELLSKALAAVRVQDWSGALGLLERAEADELNLDERVTLLAARGSANRHQGRLDLARADYLALNDELSDPQDPRRMEALVGLAECYLAAGDIDTTGTLLDRALRMSGADPLMLVRAKSVYARMLSRIDVERSLAAWRDLFADTSLAAGSARASARFYYGDALLGGGYFAQARRQYSQAQQEAEQAMASKTVADCYRREALIRVCLNERSKLQAALELLSQAEDLYKSTGDRAICLPHTERALVLASLGQYPKARVSYERGRWTARESREHLRIAHNLLGLADLYRVAKSWTMIENAVSEAERIYQRLNMSWGQFYAQIIRIFAELEQGNTKQANILMRQLRTFVAQAGPRLASYDSMWLENLTPENYYGAPLRLRFPD